MEEALRAVSTRSPELSAHPERMPAALGFAHAFDLTLLLHEAARDLNWSGATDLDRRALRDALESIEGPVEGLVKTYHRPFREFDAEDPDAHEALGVEELTLGSFRPDGLIEVEPARQGE